MVYKKNKTIAKIKIKVIIKIMAHKLYIKKMGV